MSGTIAEIEWVVWDGLDDFLYRALADNRFLHDLHFPHPCGSSKSHSHSGGPRAVVTGGGLPGSPIWVRMRSMDGLSVIAAIKRMSAPQSGQTSGSTS